MYVVAFTVLEHDSLFLQREKPRPLDPEFRQNLGQTNLGNFKLAASLPKVCSGTSRTCCLDWSLSTSWINKSIKHAVKKKRYKYLFMSLLPRYREGEEQVPTGEAGRMKKSELIFPSIPHSTLSDTPITRFMHVADKCRF